MLAQKIGGTKARKIIEKDNAILIDVRDPVSYRDGTLPNAINVSLRNISSLAKFPKTTKIIFFSSTNEDDNLAASINYAVQLGFKSIFSLGAKVNWDK